MTASTPPHRPRYLVLLASLCLLGALYPVAGPDRTGRAVWTVAFWFVLFGGQHAVLQRAAARRAARAAAGLALLAGLGMLLFATPPAWATLAYASANLAFLVITIVLVLRDVFAGTSVDVNRIAGATCIYILLGVAFGFWYHLLHAATGQSPLTPAPDRAVPFVADYLYFSFVTLTTLGYGDLAPVTPTARLSASVEAVLGQLYLTILVARLVGLHIAQTPHAPRDP